VAAVLSKIKTEDDNGIVKIVLKMGDGAIQQDLDGTTSRVDELPWYQLAEGGTVNRNPDGSFVVVETGSVLRPIPDRLKPGRPPSAS